MDDQTCSYGGAVTLEELLVDAMTRPLCECVLAQLERTKATLFHCWGPHDLCPHGERIVPAEVLDQFFPLDIRPDGSVRSGMDYLEGKR